MSSGDSTDDKIKLSRRGFLRLAGGGLVGAAFSGFMPDDAGASPGPLHQVSDLRSYNYSPSTRTLTPSSVYSTKGSVSNPRHILSAKVTRILGKGSYLTLDFGKEVGGLVTLHFAGSSSPSQRVGLAFTESHLYVGTDSDASNGGKGADGAIYADVGGSGSYTVPVADLRGGFRYLTIFLDTEGWVELDGASLYFTAAPTMADPSAYPNYFHCSDELLNKIWYAGAYTVQLSTISPKQGRVWPAPISGWNNGAEVGVGEVILVDGAKRDRTVWPGDLGISVPTAYVSFGELVSTKNALTTLYQHQRPSGELPYAGPMVNFYGSDTYHMWTLIGTYNYHLYAADRNWLDSFWCKYKEAVKYIVGKMNSRNLLQVTGTNDWARTGQGGENIEANAILYRVLMTGSELARVEGETSLAKEYSELAKKLKIAANAHLWNAVAGAYSDKPGSNLYPQDGNSLSVWFYLVDSREKSDKIMNYLKNKWNEFGARTPEWNNDIGTFPGSMEVHAHFVADDDQSGVDLIKRQWGYMLNSGLGTKSTFWEGFKADGTFAYGGPYMSNAHGWATGPTSALTFYVLGVQPNTAGGETFHVTPHPADLTFAEGQLSTPRGLIKVRWSRKVHEGTFVMELDVPELTSGRVGIPTFGTKVTIFVDGNLAWNGETALAHSAHSDGSHVYLEGISGGPHRISSRS